MATKTLTTLSACPLYCARALEAAIVVAWTDQEDADYWRIQELMYATEMSPAGGAEWARLAACQAVIYQAVHDRAVASIEATGVALAAAA